MDMGNNQDTSLGKPIEQSVSEFKQVASINKPKNRNKKIILGVAAITVLGIGLAVGAYFLSAQTKDSNDSVGEDTEEVAKFDEAGNRLVTEECPEIIYPAGDPSPYQAYLELSFRFNTCAWELSETVADNPNSPDGELPNTDVIELTHKEAEDTTLRMYLSPKTGAFGFGKTCEAGDFELIRKQRPDSDQYVGRYINETDLWEYTPYLTTEVNDTASEDFCYSGPFVSRMNFPDPISSEGVVFPQSTDYIYPEEYRILSVMDIIFEGDDSIIKDADFVVNSLATEQPFATGFDLDETEEEDVDDPTAPAAPIETNTEEDDDETTIVLKGTDVTFKLPTQSSYKAFDLSTIATPDIPQYTDGPAAWYYENYLITPTDGSTAVSQTLVGYSPEKAKNYPCGPGCIGDSFFVMTEYSVTDGDAIADLQNEIAVRIPSFAEDLKFAESKVGAFPQSRKVTYSSPIEDMVTEYWFTRGEDLFRIELFGANQETVLSPILDTFGQNVQ